MCSEQDEQVGCRRLGARPRRLLEVRRASAPRHALRRRAACFRFLGQQRTSRCGSLFVCFSHIRSYYIKFVCGCGCFAVPNSLTWGCPRRGLTSPFGAFSYNYNITIASAAATVPVGRNWPVAPHHLYHCPCPPCCAAPAKVFTQLITSANLPNFVVT